LQEKRALANTLPDPKLFQGPYRDHKNKKIVPKYNPNHLGEHHFFQLLGYNPSAIITTGHLWKGVESLSLAGLY
jgi:hypothetical protein